jgi:hypothetical protein
MGSASSFGASLLVAAVYFVIMRDYRRRLQRNAEGKASANSLGDELGMGSTHQLTRIATAVRSEPATPTSPRDKASVYAPNTPTDYGQGKTAINGQGQMNSGATLGPTVMGGQGAGVSATTMGANRTEYMGKTSYNLQAAYAVPQANQTAYSATTSTTQMLQSPMSGSTADRSGNSIYNRQ